MSFGDNIDYEQEEYKLRKKWGKDIRIIDESDSSYIPLNEDWLPVPLEVTHQMIKKKEKQIEKLMLNNPFGVTIKPTLSKIKAIETIDEQSRAKKRIPIPEWIKERIKKERGVICERCQVIVFDMYHHINGDPSDNRIENLEILCYKCHRKHHKKYGNGYL